MNWLLNSGDAGGSYVGGLIWNAVVGVLLFVYSEALGVVVWLFVAVGQAAGALVSYIIDWFFWAASFLGILALPVMAISMVALTGSLLVAFDALKDTPVVEEFT